MIYIHKVRLSIKYPLLVLQFNHYTERWELFDIKEHLFISIDTCNTEWVTESSTKDVASLLHHFGFDNLKVNAAHSRRPSGYLFITTLEYISTTSFDAACDVFFTSGNFKVDRPLKEAIRYDYQQLVCCYFHY